MKNTAIYCRKQHNTETRQRTPFSAGGAGKEGSIHYKNKRKKSGVRIFNNSTLLSRTSCSHSRFLIFFFFSFVWTSFHATKVSLLSENQISPRYTPPYLIMPAPSL